MLIVKLNQSQNYNIEIMNDIFNIKTKDNLQEIKVYFINTEIIY